MEEVRKIIKSISKSQNEEIQVALRRYNKRDYLDLRLWFQPENQTEMRPTKRGITIPLGLISELRASLQEAEKSARNWCSNKSN